MNIKQNNKLWKTEHSNQGTWYFTKKGKISRAFGTEQSTIEYYIFHNKVFNGWTITEIDDAEVPYGSIDPSREDILKNL